MQLLLSIGVSMPARIAHTPLPDAEHVSDRKDAQGHLAKTILRQPLLGNTDFQVCHAICMSAT